MTCDFLLSPCWTKLERQRTDWLVSCTRILVNSMKSAVIISDKNNDWRLAKCLSSIFGYKRHITRRLVKKPNHDLRNVLEQGIYARCISFINKKKAITGKLRLSFVLHFGGDSEHKLFTKQRLLRYCWSAWYKVSAHAWSV